MPLMQLATVELHCIAHFLPAAEIRHLALTCRRGADGSRSRARMEACATYDDRARPPRCHTSSQEQSLLRYSGIALRCRSFGTVIGAVTVIPSLLIRHLQVGILIGGRRQMGLTARGAADALAAHGANQPTQRERICR